MTAWCLQPALGTCKGRKTNNEDALNYAYPLDSNARRTYGALFVLADGVSRSKYGGIASHAAAEEMVTAYYQATEHTVEARLQACVRRANRLIYEQYQGQGKTTLTAAVFHGDDIVVAHVGDSRAYWVTHGAIMRFTTDHVIPVHNSSDDIVDRLERAIGHLPDVQPDIERLSVEKRGSLLLATDGVTRYVDDHRLKQIVNQNEPGAAVEEMIRAAYKAGGIDNISAIAVNVISKAVDEQASIRHIQETFATPVARSFDCEMFSSRPLTLNADPTAPRTPPPRTAREASPPAEPTDNGGWQILTIAVIVLLIAVALVGLYAIVTPSSTPAMPF